MSTGESCTHECGSCSSKGGCQEQLKQRLAQIKHIILVLSGKGGVGKSTVSASLSVLLAQSGYRVGLLDVDFHGPSQPTLFNAALERMTGSENALIPLEKNGVKLVSIGLLLGENDEAVIWRGPAKIGVLKQLLEDSEWGELDYLICDFPPGNGDEVLSACQMLANEDCRALVVTTPQEVALADCRKCLDFCRQLQIPVAGIVENMSGFVCPDCQKRHELFSSGGGAKLAAAFQVPLLAQIPLAPEYLKYCDIGDLPGALEAVPEVRRELEQLRSGVTR